MDKKHNNLAQPETDWSAKGIKKEAIKSRDHQGIKIQSKTPQKPL